MDAKSLNAADKKAVKDSQSDNQALQGWYRLSPLENPSGKKARVLIAVPKRVIRLATRRNRIKRLMREAILSGFFRQYQNGDGSFRIIIDKDPGDIGLKDVLSKPLP